MLQSLKQIERTGQASFNETLRLMSDGFIEVEGGGYRLTPAGEIELARLLLLELKARNRTNDRIARELGMEEDEILRLCQITGLR